MAVANRSRACAPRVRSGQAERNPVARCRRAHLEVRNDNTHIVAARIVEAQKPLIELEARRHGEAELRE
jgi:hypothetical protein